MFQKKFQNCTALQSLNCTKPDLDGSRGWSGGWGGGWKGGVNQQRVANHYRCDAPRVWLYFKNRRHNTIPIIILKTSVSCGPYGKALSAQWVIISFKKKIINYFNKVWVVGGMYSDKKIVACVIRLQNIFTMKLSAHSQMNSQIFFAALLILSGLSVWLCFAILLVNNQVGFQ